MPGIRNIAVAAVLALSVSTPVLAQDDYPTRPVRVILPYAAGGAIDVFARPLAERLSRSLGQPFVIENRAGAGGALGAEAMAKATPDGYTIMVTPQTPIVVLPLLRKYDYDPATDFVPIARLAEVSMGFAAHPSLGVKTLPEFVALAKLHPGKYSYGTNGVGTINHLRGEMLKIMAGIDIRHVPFRGDILADVLAGKVDTMMEINIFPEVKAGRLVLLAMVDEVRHPDFPNTPTIKESGFPDYDLPIWFLAVAPRGTPTPIIARLHREMSSIHDDKEFAARMRTSGVRVYPSAEAPEAIGKRLATQSAVFADIIKKANVVAE